jgi:hypothetical protein
MRRAASLTVAICVVLAGVLVEHHRASRATVGKVAQAVIDHPGADHVVVGGRTFRLMHHRIDRTTLVTAVAADTQGLDDGTDGFVSSRGALQLSWTGGASGPFRARFVSRGHQVVIVGSPATEPTRRAMSDLAARLRAS